MKDRMNSKDNSSAGMENNVTDSIVLQGNVKIIVNDDKKGEYVHFNDKNVITYAARKVMSHLLGDPSNNGKINKLILGTGGQYPPNTSGGTGGDILTPIPPSRDETTLRLPLCEDAVFLGKVYQPVGEENEVKFTFVLGKDDGNGQGSVAYTEAGLFTVDETMFAMETFPALIKNSTRQITFEWTIVF